jgi:hypothetical protein
MKSSLRTCLEERCGTSLNFVDTVVAISRIPYGRSTDRTPQGVLIEWRGTCSTKHVLLAEVVRENWPEHRPCLWHRVYRVRPDFARRKWGTDVVAAVPADGLVDVHTFATLTVRDRDIHVDVTMPLADWDGCSNVALACDTGQDYPAGLEPLATKALLVGRHCDPTAREQFIAALAARNTA